MTRVILSLQATHTVLEALRRNELSCAVAAQVAENCRAAAKRARTEEAGGTILPYGTSAHSSSVLVGGPLFVVPMIDGDQGKDLSSHPFLTLDPSVKQEGGP